MSFKSIQVVALTVFCAHLLLSGIPHMFDFLITNLKPTPKASYMLKLKVFQEL